MKKIEKIVILLLMMLSLTIISGCDSDDEVPDIYTSIYPIEFIVKNIVGEDLSVMSIYPRGKDVHDYELTPQDMIGIAKSKLIFYIGAGLEGYIEQAKESTLKNVSTVSLSEGLDLVEINSEHIHDHSHHDTHDDHGFYDPHIWLDLKKMQTMTQKVLDTLLDTFDLSDEQEEDFKKRAANLTVEFEKLDNEFRETVNAESILNKTILVDHDAYIYWEVQYGVERIKIRNDNESIDAIPKDMMNKIALAKEKKIKHICLTKNESNEKPSAIAERYQVELGLDKSSFLYLHHLATITTAEEQAGWDYLSIMRLNLQQLSNALPRK